MVSEMLYTHVQDTWCRLLTVHYVAWPYKELDWQLYPWITTLVPKFTDATHYDLIMFREQFNVFINKLIEESLQLPNTDE